MQLNIKHFVTFNTFAGYSQHKPNKTQRCQKLAKELFRALLIVFMASSMLLQLPQAYGKVNRLDEVDLGGKHYPYLYQWSDPEIKPKAIVIALHGLILHGLVYDKLANHLAQEGILVLAPDLPGFGRRYHTDSICFAKAREDMLDVIQSAKSVYSNLPVVCLGESLGANLALCLAQSRPDLIDGIILSNPALKTRLNLTPDSVFGRVNMVVGLVKTDTEVDLSPYMKAYASEDPNIIQAMVADPLIHSQIKCQELWDTYQAIRPVFKQAKLIDKETSVLILQGKQDKILKANAIIKLVSSLNSEDQTVKWFKSRGHMILEECEPTADTLITIDSWFKTHIDRQLTEAKPTITAPITSSALPLTQAVLDANNTPE